MTKNIAVAHAQVPFRRGGAERLAECLVRELQIRGFRTELVTLPFKAYPPIDVASHAFAWRLVDLDESDGDPIDLLIATKFPSYLVQHHNKVVWLVHQFRQVYDLLGTPWGFSNDTPEEQDIRRFVVNADQISLGEAKKLFAISCNVAQRLKHFNGLEAEPLYVPPPQLGQYRCVDSDSYILSVGRLNRLKRVDLLLRAMALVRSPVRAIVVGEGDQYDALRKLATDLGVDTSVEFVGAVSDECLIDMYSRALGVYFAPLDEDYGLVTIEAFSSGKPVITSNDSGAVLEFVQDEITGLVSGPEPAAIAEAIDRLANRRDEARRLGAAGRDRVREITWDQVVERLVDAGR